jgi:hypothetical protein
MDIDEFLKILHCGDASHDEQAQAADEIERLRDENERLRQENETLRLYYRDWCQGHSYAG